MVTIRVDKMSAFSCINAGRELSRTMRCALKIITRVQEAFHIKVVAQHIQTEANIVADRLSRGNFKRARDNLRKKA